MSKKGKSSIPTTSKKLLSANSDPLPNYNKKTVKNMDFYQTLTIMIKHLQKHEKLNEEQAGLFQSHLIKIHEDIVQQFQNERIEKISLKTHFDEINSKNDLTVKNTIYDDLHQLQTQNEELKKQIRYLEEEKEKNNNDLEKYVNLETDFSQLQLQHELLKTKLHKFHENSAQINADISTTVVEVNVTEEDLKTQYVTLKTSFAHTLKDLEFKSNLIDQQSKEINSLINIHDKMKDLEKLQQETKDVLKQLKENEKLPVMSTYAEVASHLTPTLNQRVSKSAILVRRKTSTKMSMNNIRNLLNRYTVKDTNIPNISCQLARDKNTFIIKAETEKDIELLADKLQNYENLQDIVELELRSDVRRKLIILGIPTEIPKEDILKKLNTDLDREIEAQIFKVLERSGTKTYQLVVEMEEKYAKYFLKKGNLLISFNSCKIVTYVPIIRCNNCQFYGHSHERCRFSKPICAYCMKNHSSNSCPIKDILQKHTCINCRDEFDSEGYPLDYHHSANSNVCHLFQKRIQSRNQATNYTHHYSRK